MAAKDTVIPGGAANQKRAKFQNIRAIIIAAVAVILFGGFAIWVQRPKTETDTVAGGAVDRLTDTVARNPGDAESFKQLNDQVQGIEGALDDGKKRDDDLQRTMDELLNAVRGENASEAQMADEMELLTQQVLDLQRRLTAREERPETARAPTPQSGPLGAGQGGAVGASPAPIGFGPRGRTSSELIEPTARRSQQVINLTSEAGAQALDAFDQAINGSLSETKEPKVFDTAHYIPANAYAPARVLVGVDAATGREAQADPQAAVFQITGPARHVVVDGEIQLTDLTGCLVNGAATGNLSTERVTIKLQKMTCPNPKGGATEQMVEGHVTQLGKAGIRGTIVSRVGDRLNKATIAGGLSGLGRAFGGVAQGGVGIGGGGGIIQEVPNTEDLALAAGGQAVAGAADTLAQYYIDQAKAIQPVVSMPTGVKVELVFISGFKARPTLSEEDR